MGKLHACFVVAILALAAGCDGDSGGTADAAIKLIDAGPDAKVFMDAPPPMFDLTCLNNTAPTTADPNITISGSVQEVSGSFFAPSIAAAGGATVDVCKGDCIGSANKLDTKTSANDGSFTSAALATGGVPFDVYLTVTRANNRTVYLYPPSPLTMDPPTIPFVTFTTTFFATAQDASKGMLIVAVTDCANMPITDTANIDLSIKQGGAEVTGTTEVDASTFDPMFAGAYLVLNVPAAAGVAGTTTSVGGSYNGMQLRAHDVRVVATTTTETILRPGY